MSGFLRKTNYQVMSQMPAGPVIIKDLGPWDQYLSVTNGAEDVVEELYAKGILTDGRQLLYYDSEMQLDEITHKDGKFTGFKAGPGSKEGS